MLYPALLPTLLLSVSAHAGRYDKVRELYDAKDMTGAAAQCERMRAHKAVDDSSLRELCAVVMWQQARGDDTVANWKRFREDWKGTAQEVTALKAEAAAALRDLGAAARPEDLDSLASEYLGTPAATEAQARSVESRLDRLGERASEEAYLQVLARAPRESAAAARAESLAVRAAVRAAASDDDVTRILEAYPGQAELSGLLPRFLAVVANPVAKDLGYELEFLPGVTPPADVELELAFVQLDGGVRGASQVLSAMGLSLPDGIALPACTQLAGGAVAGLQLQARLGAVQASWPVEPAEDCADAAWGPLVVQRDEQGSTVVAGRSIRTEAGVESGELTVGAFSVPTPPPTGAPLLFRDDVFFPVQTGWLVAPMGGTDLPRLTGEAPPEGAVPLDPTRMAGAALPSGWSRDRSDLISATGERTPVPADATFVHPLVTWVWGPHTTSPLTPPAPASMPSGFDPSQAPVVPSISTSDRELVAVMASNPLLVGAGSVAWKLELDGDPGVEWLVGGGPSHAFLVDVHEEGVSRLWPLPAITVEQPVFLAAHQGSPLFGWMSQRTDDAGLVFDTLRLLEMHAGELRGIYLERSVP